MSVIIRLQNLPWSANALDIREFFKGLSIPEGGVHIVGGELGDAFIAFSSDEDARLAMQKSGTSLKGIQITLLLSSRSEMQKVIEAARQQALGLQSFMSPVAPTPPIQPIAPAQLPSQPMQSHLQAPLPIQNQPPRITPEDQQPLLNNQNQNIYSGRPPASNQPSQNFSQPYNPQASFIPNQMPYPGQKVAGFPPGIMPQGGMPANYVYGQIPPTGSLPPPPGLPPQAQPMQTTTPSNVSTNFAMVEHQNSSYIDPSHSASKASSLKQVESKEKKSSGVSSVSSSSSRDKRERDNKGRDERRRRSKSRSRSKDRDRRRRHRSRSRSRSRDKSSRRKRSRSRERERTRERDRQRDRRDNRDSSRSHRDKSERSSHETSLEPKTHISENTTGIPGLGDIPDDIPKEGLSIFTQPSNMNPVRTKESPSNSGWGKHPATVEPKPINSSPAAVENLQHSQQKTFNLANPSVLNSFSNISGASFPTDPSLMKNSPQHPENFSSPSGDSYKEPLLSKSNEEGHPNDWTNDNRNYKDDDRGYHNPTANRNTNIDLQKGTWEGGSWENANSVREPLPQGDWGREFPRRDDDFNYNRDGNIVDHQNRGMHQERRENIYTTRSFAGGFHTDFDKEYEDRFGRGGFRGRGRRGGFGRDTDINSEPPHMGGEFHEEPPFRDMHQPDFDRGRGGGRGFFRGRGGRMPQGPDPSRERRPRTCSVEVRNVPTNASYLSIRDLFAGIFVPNGSIKILGGQRGERIGVALVQFKTTWDAFEAYKRSGGYILNARVQVKFIDDVIYEDARDIMQDNREIGRTESMEIMSPCVYVSGLPVGCTDHDVAKLFSNFKVEDIVLELEKGSRQPSGGCFVRFINQEEAERALSEIKSPNMDGTPVKVSICSTEAMNEATKERQKIKMRPPQNQTQSEKYKPSDVGTKEHIMAITQHLKNIENDPEKNNSNKDEKNHVNNQNENGPSKGGDLLTDSIVIKNVSAEIDETSIRDFFSDEGIIPEKICINKPNSERRCEVFVIFPKISDAKQAVKKNSQLLGSTEVTVELISKPSVMLAMGLTFDPRELFLKGHKEQKGDDILEEEENGNNDSPTHEDFPPKKMSPSHYDNYMRGGRNYNPRYNQNDKIYQGGYRPRPPFRYGRENDRHPSEHRNFDERMGGNRNSEGPQISEPPQNFGKPGCVVALANIPYHATTEDILVFFKDFDGLQPENVIRRYDERNRPTSDSRVSLFSPEEAIKAVETLNHKYMLGRQIHVALVN